MSDAYRSSGVDYDVLDAAKRRSIEAVLSTLEVGAGRGANVDRATIGEPAQVVEVDGVLIATVLECLGTKSTIAREVEDVLGENHWSAVGVDAVGAIVNDLGCVGAVPLTVSAYVATGSAEWYSGDRHALLVEGWRSACVAAGAAWVGGESPTLSGIVGDASVDIAGSAVGRIPAGSSAWLGSRLEEGDEVVLISSAGLHANGASMARAVAAQLPEGWATPLASGRSLGAAVLAPSALYSQLVESLQESPFNRAVHYASHITGHGLRKIMRADRALTYRLTTMPEVPEVLAYLAGVAGLDSAAAYGVFNMGTGLALYVSSGTGDRVVEMAHALGYSALVGGVVEPGPRRVILEPVAVTYDEEELAVR